MEHKYQSVQLKVPPMLTNKALAFQDKFIAQENLAGIGYEDRPHVTVLYGLENSSLKEIKPIFEGFGSLKIWFGKVKAFLATDTGKAEDVLYVEVLGREVDILHLLCTAFLPHISTNPFFNPHMTLAYMRPGTAVKLVGNTWFDGLNVTIDKIEFSETNEVVKPMRLNEEIEIEGRTHTRVPEECRPLSGSIAAAFGYRKRDGKGWVPKNKFNAFIKLTKELDR